jgi:hypothetical protein
MLYVLIQMDAHLNLYGVIQENDSKTELMKPLAEKFVMLLQHNTSTLEEVHLLQNYLDDDFVTVFAKGLECNTGATSIAGSLQNNTIHTIEEIDLI